ncbi:hypothetical protein HJG60_011585 [Phyllostomus discolor]|uniref:Uncharacterized protein n=1 Tax=Phyllostomus discolor TaxID=89673 RepID=A0A833ZNV0_9CHIR|nr:hypothetical protein HJG60_011585 [Phyllostomus discolor]
MQRWLSRPAGRHRPGQAASSGNSVERQKVMESIKAYELRDVNMPGINRGADGSAPEWSLALARDVGPGFWPPTPEVEAGCSVECPFLEGSQITRCQCTPTCFSLFLPSSQTRPYERTPRRGPEPKEKAA